MTGDYRGPEYGGIQKIMPDSREMNLMADENVYSSKPAYNN